MKLTAGGKPFGEKQSKEEAIAAIKKILVEIGEICGYSEDEVNKQLSDELKKRK